MKRILALLFAICLLFTACRTTSPSSESTTTSVSETAANTESTPSAEEGADYSAGNNPYNAKTVVTDEYIFVADNGAIYRAKRQTTNFEEFITQENSEVLVGYSAPSIAVCDNSLYFLSPNHLIDRDDQETIDTFELRLFRADTSNGNIAQVGILGGDVHTLHSHDGYLIAHNVNDLPYVAEAPEIEPDTAFRVFLPNTTTNTLEEISFSSLDGDTQDKIKRFIGYYDERRVLEDRLYAEPPEASFGAFIRANDAYYFTEFMSSRLYRAPLEEGAPVEVPLVDEATQALQQAEQLQLVNYDAEWLYFSVYPDIFRIRKDGTAFEMCVTKNNHYNGTIDSVDGNIIHIGIDGEMYLWNQAGGSDKPIREFEPAEPIMATFIEFGTQPIVQPSEEMDRQNLGDRISVGNQYTIWLDENGEYFDRSMLKEGMTLALYSKGEQVSDVLSPPMLDCYKVIVYS